MNKALTLLCTVVMVLFLTSSRAALCSPTPSSPSPSSLTQSSPSLPTRVRLEVSCSDPDLTGASARILWLGEERRVELVGSGSGLLEGSLSGEAVRFLPVELWVDDSTGESQRAYSGLERVGGVDTVLRFSIEHVRPAQARRLSAAMPAAQVNQDEALRVGLGLLWVALCVTGLALLARRPRRVGARLESAPDVGARRLRRWAAWPLWATLWLVLAAAWTWPAVRGSAGQAVGLHFDLPGTLWALHAVPRLLPDLLDPLTAWPLGGDYRRFDSFTLLPVAWLLQMPFSGLSAARLHGLIATGGLAITGLATQLAARGLGVRRPWDLLAGLLFVSSGLAANALLEGHVYLVMDPFMPLFLWAWWRATGPQGRPCHGLAAGLLFVLTLLTSAYLGLSAAVIAVCLLAWGLLRTGRRLWLPALVAAAVVLVVAVPYLWPFLHTFLHTASAGQGALGQAAADSEAIQLASTHLASLAAVTPEVDRAEHSLSLALSGLMVGLCALAPVLLSRRQRWQPVALAALMTLLLALGPKLAPGTHDAWFPLPMALVADLPITSLLRFPARLAWGSLLCGSILAGLVAGALEQRLGRAVRLLLLLAVVEAVVMVRLPWRQGTMSTTAPQGYSSGLVMGAQSGAQSGAVLDYFPEGLDAGGEQESWFTGLSCLYQIQHGRPIADDCVKIPVDTGPRYLLGRWLSARLLSGQVAAAGQQLRAMGFSTVAMHADLFSRGDQGRLVPALSTWAQPQQSTTGGERILFFDLPADSGQAAAQAVAGTHPPAGASAAERQAYEQREARVPLNRAVATGGVPATPIANVQSLRVELLIPKAKKSDDYRLELTASDGEQILVPIQNRGDVADDLPEDRVWVGQLLRQPSQAQLGGRLDVRLLVARSGEDLVAWSGPVLLTVADDRLVLAELSSDPPRFGLAVAATNPQDQPANRDSGLVAAVGWLLILTLCAVLAALRQWDRVGDGRRATGGAQLRPRMPR